MNKTEKNEKLTSKGTLKKFKKNVKGITLIALVVTIIVLLILAGVAINLSVGENGIFKRAQNAKDITEQAEENEQKAMTQLEATMSLQNEEYIDSNGDKAIIPKGFAVSKENIIEDGLVILDAKGNEFVWVPCTENEYKEADDSWTKYEYDNKTWTDEQALNIGLESIKNMEDFILQDMKLAFRKTQ